MVGNAEIYWNSDEERQNEFRRLLQHMDQEAKNCVEALELPEQTGYDVLAVIHGQAFMGEREVFQREGEPPSLEETTSSLQHTSSPLQKGEEALSDDMLISMVQKDPSSNTWELLFKRYKMPLSAYVRRYCTDQMMHEEIVEEIVCETLSRLYSRIRNGSPDKFPLKAWLFTTAHHLLVDVHRRYRREESVFDQGVEHMNTHTERGKRFNVALQEARLKKRWTQAEAAEMLQVPLQTYACWEKGKQIPHLSSLQKLQRVFGLTDEAFALIFPSLRKNE